MQPECCVGVGACSMVVPVVPPSITYAVFLTPCALALDYNPMETPRHQPQMGRIKLSFCSETASIKLRARDSMVYLITYGFFSVETEISTKRSDQEESHLARRTENDSMIPVKDRLVPASTSETRNATLPSTVLPLEVDHRIRPIRLPTIEACVDETPGRQKLPFA